MGQSALPIRRRWCADASGVGLSACIDIGLPALRLGRTLAPHDPQAARVQSFFAMLASIEDTNLLYRGGADGLRFAARAASNFLERGGVRRHSGVNTPTMVHEHSSRVGSVRADVPTCWRSPCSSTSSRALVSGTAVLCSGQGLQSADMFDLFGDAPEAAPYSRRQRSL